MRRLPFFFIALVAAGFVCISAPLVGRGSMAVLADGLGAASPNVALVAEESGLATDINQLRIANGEPALSVDPVLIAVARARAQDQVNQHYFSHTSPQGQTVFDLLNTASIPWTDAGENLAESNGGDAVQAAIDGFSKSPPHRANMLSTSFGRIGIGAAVASDGTTIFAVVFTN